MSDDTESAPPKVDIFSFRDYRDYLKAVYEHLKATRRRFSYRYFAKTAGFGGQSYLRMVMDGERNLSPTSINKCTRALRLGKKETLYFETLVLYAQAKTPEDKERYYNQLAVLRPKVEIKGLSRDQFEYLTQSHFVAIRELAAMPEFEDDVTWIAKNLRKPLKPTEIKHALEVLERLKLLVRDKKGNLKHSHKTLQTPVDAPSHEIFDFHREVLAESRDAILSAPAGEWDVTSMTIPIPKASLSKVMDVLQSCREEIVDLISSGSEDYHEVFQINMQVFPVTKTKQQKTSD